jgi:hypothetical protein
LERLAANQQLTSALSRVLADDRKKSIALTTNILEVFFCFSSISQLHSVLTANKIGNTALNVIDFELKRYEVRVRETRGESDYARLQAYLFKQEKLLFVCFYILLNMSEDLAIELRIKQRKVIPMLFTVLAHHDNKDTTYLAHLRLLCVAFLKKLSMIESNIPELLQVWSLEHAPFSPIVFLHAAKDSLFVLFFFCSTTLSARACASCRRLLATTRSVRRCCAWPTTFRSTARVVWR